MESALQIFDQLVGGFLAAIATGGGALARYGISVARRAWAVTENVINTWSAEQITTWLER